MRPQLDVSVPGRTSLVWRSGGVWVELWHPDTATPQSPEPVVRASARRGRLRGPGGRLLFTRNKKTTPTP